MSACLSVRPSVRLSARLPVRMEKLGPNWMDFCDISFLKDFFFNLSRNFKFR